MIYKSNANNEDEINKTVKQQNDAYALWYSKFTEFTATCSIHMFFEGS